MTGVKNFGDHTHWDRESHDGDPSGWYLPGSEVFIRPGDPSWNRLLDHARNTYGDPNIHYDTDSIRHDRHLVFSDGTNLPEDGAVVYHDAGTKQNWAQNDDGSVSLLGPDGKPGPAVAPAGYRQVGDHYAPVSGNGQQIAPQLAGLPGGVNGFHTDSKSGVLTSKNAAGDYYVLGPDAGKSFFDKNDKPITGQQFDDPSRPRPSTTRPADPELPTNEQQSGQAADAIKKLQDELKARYSTISDAEEKLSEVLLSAHATSADGQAKLNDIQAKIAAATKNPTMDIGTAAGEKSYLIFLRNQVGAVKDLLSAGALSAADQSKTAQALAALYAVDSGGTGQGADPADPPPPNPAPGPVPAAAAPAELPDSADSSMADPGLGPAPQMPDPLSPLLGGAPLGADPLSSLASAIPGGLGGGLGGGGGSPLDGLSGLAGAASPLAGLTSLLGDQGGHDHHSDGADGTDDSPNGKHDKTDTGTKDKTEPAPGDTTPGNASQPPAGPDQQPPPGTPGGAPAPLAPPAPPSPVVALPDGSTANARAPRTAQAVRDVLAGGTVDSSYRQNGFTLPPPGTPVTNPVDPSRLACGDVAMFTDHYEPVLSSVKGYLNGQVVPLSSVTSSPQFMGFIDPTAAATAGGPTPPVVPPVPPLAMAVPGTTG